MQTARTAFARRAREWELWRDDHFALRYILRHGPAHLADAHRKLTLPAGAPSLGWTEESLRATLCNPAFLQAKAEAGMPYDVVKDFSLGEGDGDWAGHGDLVRLFARAYNQEFHSFEEYPEATAQQLINNLFARYSGAGTVGQWVERIILGACDRPSLRRLNRALAARPSTALERVLSGHRNPITSVAVSPEGEHIASADVAGSVRVWRRRDGAPEAEFVVSVDAVTGLLWLDEHRLASTGLEGRLAIWDWQAKTRLAEWRTGDACVRALSLTASKDLALQRTFIYPSRSRPRHPCRSIHARGGVGSLRFR